MTVVGIAMVKDEADIIGTTITNMVRQCDHVLIWDDDSSDGTREMIIESDVRLANNFLDNFSYMRAFKKAGYYQSKKMTALAKLAENYFDATWVIPFDADEIWTSQWGTLKEVCESHEDTYGIIKADLYDHMVTGHDKEHMGSDPVHHMQWHRVAALPLPKVACRTHPSLVIRQGNHHATFDIPARITEQSPIIVHHYPYRSIEQFIRKVRNGAAAYAKTDLPETAGAHWRKWGKFSDAQLEELFWTYYYVENPRCEYDLDGERQPPLIRNPVKVSVI